MVNDLLKKSVKGINISKYFAVQYLYLIIAMFVLRMVFLLKNIYKVETEIPFSIYIKSFYIGWIFDTSIASYFLLLMIVLLLLYLPGKIVKMDRYFEILFYLFFVSLSFLILMGMIIDAEYYKTYGFHLNSTISDYAGKPSEIVKTIWSDYPVILDLILFVVIFIPFILVSLKNYKKFKEHLKENNIGIWITRVVTLVLMIGILVLGARGGIGSGTLNWGRGYFSEYGFANQLSINGVFTLIKSYKISAKESKFKTIKISMSDEELKNEIREVVNDKNSEYANGKNFLLRTTSTGVEEKKYNVVMILMESWMAEYIGALKNNPGVTPEFDKLSKEGIFFTNFYANGNRSNRGVVSTLCSFPSQYGNSVMQKMIASKEKFITIPSILKERGYSTSFIYGGDVEFDNMKGFLSYNGVDRFIDERDFSAEERKIKWGVPDDLLFKKAIEVLDKSKQPFFANIFTLSNHPPFDIEKKYEKYSEKEYKNYKQLNAFRFSDMVLGEFIREISKREYAKNTLFVFVADHGHDLGKDIELDSNSFHIPLLFYSPGGMLKPEVVTKVGSQVDLMPTLMHFLGGKYKNSSWGKDLMSENENNTAYLLNNEFAAVVKGDKYVVKSLETEAKIVDIKTGAVLKGKEYENEKKELEKAAKLQLELSVKQIDEGSYGEK